jgi:HAE1 family hydrophobic/amphiphilic exporter-1
MTSFAFIAGLLPLVVASGAGAIGNRTIGATGVGGMLVGTVLGVLVIPGLYYLFGKLADGRKLLRDEADNPLSELFERNPLEAETHDGESAHLPYDADHAPPTHHPRGEDEGGLPEATEIPHDDPQDPEHPSGGVG